MSGRDARVALLVGTRKGLFVARSDARRRDWSLEGPHLAGYEVYYAFLDRRDGVTAYAAVRHIVWGVHLHRSADGGSTWDLMPAVPDYGHDDRPVKAVWHLAPGHVDEPATLYAGIEPAGLFVSRDSGGAWEPVRGLNEHPSRESWQPAKGGLALHSVHVDPTHRGRVYAAVSAGGVYRSDDGGESWVPKNEGVRAEYLPEQSPVVGHCVHRLVVHPARAHRLYRQCHTGTYRSDDRGDTWAEITHGLPSDFGYALTTDPGDPDTVFTIPEESSHLRTTVEGRLRVYRSSDAGATWAPLTRGLPQENVFVTVLREAIDSDGLDPCGVYFGTSGGHLFGSSDGGDTWSLIAGFLPTILSVRVASLSRPA